MDATTAHAWIAAAAAAIDEHADELTALDSAIGDGDHGVNLRRGFTAAVEAIKDQDTAGDVLVRAGTTLVSKVGGASGPLYGSALRAMGKALQQDGDDEAALRAALDAIVKLGKAELGDKTMVDAFSPAVEAFEHATGGTAAKAEAAAEAAAGGMRATTDLQARKGRASYLGERSVGHRDPGATSTWLLFDALARVTGPDPGR